MDEELIKEAYILKEKLENDERVKLLNQAEKLMEQDEDVMRLSYAFEMAQTNYNDMLRFYDQNSDEVKNAQKKLYEAKKQLDSHTLVIDYLKKYQEVRKMYRQIEESIFAKFNNHKCINEKR